MQLTTAQIEAATGRELDALIAEFIMGWTAPLQQTATCFPEFDVTATPPDWSGSRYQRVPEYSSDGNAMLAVVDKMTGDGWMFSSGVRTNILIGDAYMGPACSFLKLNPDAHGRCEGATLPEAVSRAALLAILAQREATRPEPAAA